MQLVTAFISEGSRVDRMTAQASLYMYVCTRDRGLPGRWVLAAWYKQGP